MPNDKWVEEFISAAKEYDATIVHSHNPEDPKCDACKNIQSMIDNPDVRFIADSIMGHSIIGDPTTAIISGLYLAMRAGEIMEKRKQGVYNQSIRLNILRN